MATNWLKELNRRIRQLCLECQLETLRALRGLSNLSNHTLRTLNAEPWVVDRPALTIFPPNASHIRLICNAMSAADQWQNNPYENPSFTVRARGLSCTDQWLHLSAGVCRLSFDLADEQRFACDALGGECRSSNSNVVDSSIRTSVASKSRLS